jgi:hypothetical protein
MLCLHLTRQARLVFGQLATHPNKSPCAWLPWVGLFAPGFVVATRFVTCLNFLNTVNREKALSAASNLGC